jgi:hypothetical protein
MKMASFNKSAPSFDRPMVYIVMQGSADPNAWEAHVVGIFGDAEDAQSACAPLLNAGKAACVVPAMISTPGKLDDYDTVWLHWGTGSASFTAFGSMMDADRRRETVGRTVKAYPVQGWAGMMDGGKVKGAGDLRKLAAGDEIIFQKLVEFAKKLPASALGHREDWETLANIAISTARRNPKSVFDDLGR